ncbi:MAG: hypothetical protein ACXVPN_16425 [Bacteroidia bacterium]
MKSIKRIAVVLAICGASIGLNAQTNDQPAKRKTNSENGSKTETEYHHSGVKKSNSDKSDMKGSDYKHSGIKKSESDKSDMNKSGYQHSGKKPSGKSGVNKTGMSETTFQQTPEKQDKTSVNVPEAVSVAFNNDYYTRDITPVWKKEGENYRAEFRNGSIGSVAIYDKNGKLVESERELGDGEYPNQITMYGNNKAARVWESNRDGEIKYFTKDDSGHLTWFDKDGKHISSSEHHVAHHNRSYK